MQNENNGNYQGENNKEGNNQAADPPHEEEKKMKAHEEEKKQPEEKFDEAACTEELKGYKSLKTARWGLAGIPEDPNAPVNFAVPFHRRTCYLRNGTEGGRNIWELKQELHITLTPTLIPMRTKQKAEFILDLFPMPI